MANATVYPLRTTRFDLGFAAHGKADMSKLAASILSCSRYGLPDSVSASVAAYDGEDHTVDKIASAVGRELFD